MSRRSMVSLPLRVPVELLEALDAVAKKERVQRSTLLREILVNFIRDEVKNAETKKNT